MQAPELEDDETRVDGSVARANGPTASAAPHLDRYDLVDCIGRGGMGAVYRARHRSTGQLCALKHVDPHGAHAEVILTSLEREYQTLKGLDHPRIIRVFEYGVLTQGAYYTMELLGGEDLKALVPVDWRQLCQYLRDIATSLSLLHARRLIHRDLSPGNVKVTADGHCKLIDFGALSEFGFTNKAIGTPPFVAPEVLEVGHLDQRVDLFALGALGYYCLTGRHAFPAREFSQLPEAWDRVPAAPSSINRKVPRELDELVLSLLRTDPLARPASAAEVIARLTIIGDLPPEPDEAQRTLAQSFISAPSYVGRVEELARAGEAVTAAKAGHGCALRVVGPGGSGRTRLLEEIAVRAQLAGAVVVRADASVQRGRYGTLRSLAQALADAAPEESRRCAPRHQHALQGLQDPDLLRSLQRSPDEPIRMSDPPASGYVRRSSAPPPGEGKPRTPRPSQSVSAADNPHSIEDWFLDVSEGCPLVLVVDNVEDADDASLGALVALARAAPCQRVALIVAEQSDSPEQQAFGIATLRAACAEMAIRPLSQPETTELLRRLFGDAPRVDRLAQWLHEETGGSPLHCLGLVSGLVANGSIRHESGVWLLPGTRPDIQLSGVLEDALVKRVERLSVAARELAQSLSLQRLDATLELCRRLTPEGGAHLPALLDELVAGDVLRRHQDRCSFSSAALRQAMVTRMDPAVRRKAHLRLGRALCEMAGQDNLALRLEGGLHLIRGGERMRGADMIAEVATRPIECNLLVANLFRIGEPVEAALKVYNEARKSRRERLPLLSVLAQAGYYEHYSLADQYGDEGLDVLEDLSGLGLARRLRRFVGGHLALAIGMGLAAILHYLAPRRVRHGSFIDLLEYVCSAVTSLCGVAAIRLDAERCDRVAAVLSPVDVLPKRIALVGIYRFCQGLQQIAREHQAEAFDHFDDLAAKFNKPGYYLLLPPEGNIVYVTGCHFARGAFAMMKANGAATLESADVLERSGLPLYLMIASQLRRLYHLNRGELGLADAYLERVETHAARVGSAWQVELWEPASLIPFYLSTRDVVGLARVSHRLSQFTDTIESMWRYRELSRLAAAIHGGDRARALVEELLPLLDAAPRSYIGLSTAVAGYAMSLNHDGEYQDAQVWCDRVLGVMTEADREYVMIFLLVELQAAVADAGLGRVSEAIDRLESLIARHTPSGHPLALGLLHEARARIAYAAGLHDVWAESTREAARWMRPTGTPSLLSVCDQLLALGTREVAQVAKPQVGSNDQALCTQTLADSAALPRG